MPDGTFYEPGTPCWADLIAPDPQALTGFYTGLFGWRAEADAPGHTMFSLPDGRSAAALLPHPPGTPHGTPAMWTVYFSVSDAEAAAGAVRSAGGTVVVGPRQAGPLGWFAIVRDIEGAHLGLWRPGEFHGAAVTAGPGAFCRAELTARDVEGARAFYGAVFGWEGDTRPFGPTTYTEWRRPGRRTGERTGERSPLAGMVRMDEHWPAEVPAHWMIYFAVADCDATATRAAELGGTVSVPPSDIPSGRFAVLGDPQGGFFSVIAPSVPSVPGGPGGVTGA